MENIKETVFITTQVDINGTGNGNPRCYCSLCGRQFRAPTPYHRFCSFCREEEQFRFSEWL